MWHWFWLRRGRIAAVCFAIELNICDLHIIFAILYKLPLFQIIYVHCLKLLPTPSTFSHSATHRFVCVVSSLLLPSDVYHTLLPLTFILTHPSKGQLLEIDALSLFNYALICILLRTSLASCFIRHVFIVTRRI